MQQNKPEDYKHIKAWGQMIGSYGYYIRDQQTLAAQQNAPLDVVYKDTQTNEWVTFGQVDNRETHKIIQSFLDYDSAERL